MSGPVHWHRAYGLRIRSAVALPFDPLPEPSASEPDVTVRLGAVPETLPGGPATRSPFSLDWQARPGAFLMQVKGVARYLVAGGRDVLVEPLGADAGGVSDFFPSTPFTALLQQRGVATLHAAAVATGAGAVLLLGRSSIGKSSLAAALVERGWALLADDVTGVVPDAGGRPVALPGFSRQRLCAHVLDEMGWRGRARSRVRDGAEKYWTPAQRACAAPLPVRAAFVLAVADRPEVGIESVPPNLAFRVLRHNTGDGGDGGTSRAFPRPRRDGAAGAGGAGDETPASVPARHAGGPRRGAPARCGSRPRRHERPESVEGRRQSEGRADGCERRILFRVGGGRVPATVAEVSASAILSLPGGRRGSACPSTCLVAEARSAFAGSALPRLSARERL